MSVYTVVICCGVSNASEAVKQHTEPCSLETLQKEVGGNIEILPTVDASRMQVNGKGLVAYANEEGLLRDDLARNFLAEVLLQALGFYVDIRPGAGLFGNVCLVRDTAKPSAFSEDLIEIIQDGVNAAIEWDEEKEEEEDAQEARGKNQEDTGADEEDKNTRPSKKQKTSKKNTRQLSPAIDASDPWIRYIRRMMETSLPDDRTMATTTTAADSSAA